VSHSASAGTHNCSAESFCRGHEGEGSVLALLKVKGWAQELSAGFSYVDLMCIRVCVPHQRGRYSLNEFAVFKCTIKLTDAGLPHWEDVVALVLHYMRIMRLTGTDKLTQLYDEQTAIDAADFQFQSRQTEETYVDKISNSLLQYPANLVLYGRLCCVEPVFDYDVFSQLLQYFSSSNMRIHVTAPLSQQPSPDLPWLTAPWYGTQYRVSSLADSFAEYLGTAVTSDGDLQAVLEVRPSASSYHFSAN
jgi:insulysin